MIPLPIDIPRIEHLQQFLLDSEEVHQTQNTQGVQIHNIVLISKKIHFLLMIKAKYIFRFFIH